jgi:hypothetical protein
VRDDLKHKEGRPVHRCLALPGNLRHLRQNVTAALVDWNDVLAADGGNAVSFDFMCQAATSPPGSACVRAIRTVMSSARRGLAANLPVGRWTATASASLSHAGSGGGPVIDSASVLMPRSTSPSSR